MARTRAGDWDGPNVIEDHITYLRNTRRLPGEGYVEARVPPAKEIPPAPEEGERVIFCSHFLQGFGLPVSGFLRSFLQFYHLQLHQLTPNTVVLLSAFVTLCEGYLGVLSTLELWGSSSTPNSVSLPRTRRLSAAPLSRYGTQEPAIASHPSP